MVLMSQLESDCVRWSWVRCGQMGSDKDGSDRVGSDRVMSDGARAAGSKGLT